MTAILCDGYVVLEEEEGYEVEVGAVEEVLILVVISPEYAMTQGVMGVVVAC